ncbi:MAG: Uncharacterised protein [Polaribacter sp. SA4-10]|nr:MAG: Uncharacterised protein [Polaribacter sp. SA4-10]|tara:strand:+ start:4826 stop:5572 length:747 start_codon:yes stop_codon:yes gene_type:complete
MRKLLFLLALLTVTTFCYAQKSQRIAFIDMEYILENLPEYLNAQNTLDAKVSKWKKILDKEARYIEVLKTDLANEKAILIKGIIEEKEEEITIKQEELRRLESLYFGPRGDLFQVRKQLVKPIQDQVYNEIQKIVKAKKYDFVFDKSSDLIMLYSNKKYDISEIILSSIDKSRKINERDAKKKAAEKGLSEKQRKQIANKEAIKAKKRIALNKKKEARKKLIEEKRQLLRDRKEAAKKRREEKKEKQE